MNTIINDQIKLLTLTTDSAIYTTRLVYRKGRYDFTNRLKPAVKDSIIITWVILAILYTVWNDLIIWGVDRYVQSCIKQDNTITNGDDNSQSDTVDPNVDDYQPIIPAIEEWEEGRKERQSGKTVAQSITPLEASVTVKVITDDMLLSKKGRILTGSARQARIDKLIKEGYELI